MEAVEMLPAGAGGPPPESAAAGPSDLNLREATNRLERELLLEAQRRSNGVRKEAARLLGIDPRNLNYYFRKHGLAEGGEPGGGS
jgi:transcriptional regulator with GAF, ATPase, and Fis domain